MAKKAPGKPTYEKLEKKVKALERVEEELAHVRKKLEGVTEMARLGYWEHDIINDIYTFNDQFYSIYHTTAEEAGGYTMSSEEYIRRFVHPEDLPAIRSNMQEVYDSGYSITNRLIEHRILYPDGGTGYVAVTSFLVTDSEGKPARAYGVNQNITERKMAEASLRDEIALRRTLVDRSKDGIVTLDPDGKIIESNQQFAHMLGYSLEEIQQLHVWDWDAMATREEILEQLGMIDETGGYHETRHRRKDGSLIDVEVSANRVKYKGHKLIFAIHRDITGRKQAERERLAHLKHFESMDKVNRAIQGTNELDEMMRDVLDAVLSIFNCDRAFLLYPCDPEAPFWSVPMERTRPEYPGATLGKPFPMNSDVARALRINLSVHEPVSFSPGSDYPPSRDYWEKHGFRSQMVIALHPKVGKPWQFGLHQCSHARNWTDVEKALFEKIAQRLSDSLTSLLMYRDLRKSEEFLSSIVDNIPDTIFVKDAEELKFVSVNRAGEKLLGFSKEELLGKNSYDLVPEEQARLYAESDRGVLDRGMPEDIPDEIIWNKKGEPRIIRTKKIPIPDDTGKPQHLLTISEDITDVKKLQAQLNQAQKMEALGAMSGGIAHDFNNILQPMLGFCEFLKEDLPADSPQQEFVDGIFKSGLRAKDLVNQILAFSRQSDRRMIRVELPMILKEAVKLCRSTIPSNIEIIQDYNKEFVTVMADPTQVHQIIMNLMVNAYHAVAETGGEISVHLKETQLGKDDLKGISLQPGKYARLSISDTGCGMEQAVLEKIFDPYFTTKAQGKGTGLGLAVVYGIVKEHGGHINVYSEVGKGSTFNVYLPTVKAAPEALPAENDEMPRFTGHEHVLLVDDEEVIVQLESRMLKRLGYRVTACPNGAEALGVFSENPNAFDLVLTDMNMPGMTGDRLAREIIAIRPDIPIIICTGFSEKIGIDKAKAIGVMGFLMKPVTVLELSEKVRKVLDDPSDVIR